LGALRSRGTWREEQFVAKRRGSCPLKGRRVQKKLGRNKRVSSLEWRKGGLLFEKKKKPLTPFWGREGTVRYYAKRRIQR